MTATEFKTAVKNLGWKYVEASEKLGKSVASIKLYATGASPVPNAVAERLQKSLAPLRGAAFAPEDTYSSALDSENEASAGASSEDMQALRTRIQNLEEENLRLRHQRDDLKKENRLLITADYDMSKIEGRGERAGSSIGKEGFFGTLGKKEGE